MHDRPAIPDRVRTLYSGRPYDVLEESEDDDVVWLSQTFTPSKSRQSSFGKAKPTKAKGDTTKDAEKNMKDIGKKAEKSGSRCEYLVDAEYLMLMPVATA